MVQVKGFSAGNHDPRKTFDVLPPDWYGMMIVASEVRKTKDQVNAYLLFEFETLEAQHPQHKGRKVWVRLNLWNQNQQAVEIAQGELSAICHAVGVMDDDLETEALHHKPIAVKVKVRPASGDFEASNEASGFDAHAARFKPQQGFVPPGAAPAQQQPAPAQAQSFVAPAPAQQQPAQAQPFGGAHVQPQPAQPAPGATPAVAPWDRPPS